MRMNPYRYNAPPHWNDISTAPRDGTPIEIQNNWGVAPHYGVCRWDERYGYWQYINDERRGMDDGPHLSWRPYDGDAESYIDPSGGAQNTRNYWLMACGRAPEPTGFLSFEEEDRLERARHELARGSEASAPAVAAAEATRPWWKRLLAVS